MNKFGRTVLAVTTLILVGLTAACGGSDGDAGIDISGSWNGTWRNTNPVHEGTMNVTLLQNGAAFTGNVTMTNVPVINTVQGPISGTISGNVVSASTTDPGVTRITTNMTLSPDGWTMNGTYVLTPGDFTGTLTVSR